MKYLRISALLFIVMLLAIGCKPPGSSSSDSDPWDGNYKDNEYATTEAGPEDYVDNYATVWKRLEGHFPDETKTNGTSNMCWAYASASLLVYGGWETDMRLIINRMHEHYGNVPYNAPSAIFWYFETYLPGQYRSYYRIMESKLISVPAFMASSIENGYPISLFLYGSKFNHIIAVYGYRWIPEAEQWEFLTVQGDDAVHTKVLTLTWTGDRWQIGGTYSSFHDIGYAVYLRPEWSTP
jgi:hypothetical protein